MAHQFVWADLSMLDDVQDFYTAVFGWVFSGGNYDMAFSGNDPVAAVFPMPEKFRAMSLPSFWMSYISVAELDAAVARATDFGGRLELHDKAQGVALIRDPLGAGFTICDDALTPGAIGQDQGLRSAHSLHVSNQDGVKNFYQGLFGWSFQDQDILGADGHKVGAVFEESDAQRGGYEYWSVAFAVANFDATIAEIQARGGAINGPCNSKPGAFSVADPNGAAFVIHPSGGR